jgi:hypothetical protein
MAIYRALGSATFGAYTIGALGGAIVGFTLGYIGIDNTTPMDVAAVGQVNAPSVTVTAPSITTVTANAWLVGFFGWYDGNGGAAPTWSAPFGTDRQNGSRVGALFPDTVSADAADAVQAVAGASGTKTSTASIAQSNIGILTALRPVVAVAVLNVIQLRKQQIFTPFQKPIPQLKVIPAPVMAATVTATTVQAIKRVAFIPRIHPLSAVALSPAVYPTIGRKLRWSVGPNFRARPQVLVPALPTAIYPTRIAAIRWLALGIRAKPFSVVAPFTVLPSGVRPTTIAGIRRPPLVLRPRPQGFVMPRMQGVLPTRFRGVQRLLAPPRPYPVTMVALAPVTQGVAATMTRRTIGRFQLSPRSRSAWRVAPAPVVVPSTTKLELLVDLGGGLYWDIVNGTLAIKVA